jgi:hypothetical protein
MSNIEFKPNASGTGTFTITSPATNTNRTLTLPDAAGEIYVPGNILGTVSQSGGVATGAIIERGSNANGEFVKFADGTLICTRTCDKDNGTTTQKAFNYAASFASTANMGISLEQTGGSWLSQSRLLSFNTTGFEVIVQNISDGGLASTTRTSQLIAIGRWF